MSLRPLLFGLLCFLSVVSCSKPADVPAVVSPSTAVARAGAPTSAETGSNQNEAAVQADRDAAAFAHLVQGAIRVLARMQAEQSLLDRPAEQPLGADERTRALSLFSEVLDHAFALDAIAQRHFERWKGSPLPTSPASVRHLDLGFAAYVEKLALVLAFVDRTINKPQFEKLYDEGAAADGLPAGAYARLKWGVVHLEEVARTLTVHQLVKVAAPVNARLTHDASWRFVVERLEERYATVKMTLKARAVHLFGGNSVDIGVDLAHAAWFPIQAGAAEWMGDTRVHRHTMLITAEQVREAIVRSEPGDVIVERRNWYLSNIGLPGFWPHAALWIGSPAELARWAADPAIDAAFDGSFIGFLQKRHPEAWRKYIQDDHDGNPRRVLEAISEGVVFNAAEESIRADYVAALRPARSRLEKARAIERAFSYAGRPYDFDFDFYTDSKLVCSELVFKAYEPRSGVQGLTLGLEKMVGRMALGPNSIVRAYDQQRGTKDEQFVFGWFLDGHERQRTATFADEEALRASWKRPKWDVVQK